MFKKAILFTSILLITFYGYSFIAFITSEQYVANTFTAPIPKLLVNTFLKNETGILWRPSVKKTTSSSQAMPVITATSALTYDLTDEKLLYAKDIHKRLPLASLTKIMTAIIALDSMSLDKKITVTESASTIGENSMGLSRGETLTLSDLLYGLILHSGNDAAETIAQNSPFGRENFVYLMNKKAEELGLSNTRFTNPSGLEGDGMQYSTAYDLLVITRHALSYPEFAKVAATVEYEIPYTSEHKAFYLYNETNLLTSYPGVKGVKTGYTEEAGLCLVTYLEYKGRKIVGVLFDSASRRSEMAEILDYSLKTLGVTPPPHS
jgi:D-alanyl-D-alanine carboxypeptidase (penicillin-binding protein 5/6)